MNLVVVSFAHEFASLLLQARSLARSNAFEYFDEYIVIWNDDHEEEFFWRKYGLRIENALEGFATRLRVIFRNQMIDSTAFENIKGSRIQQVLKLICVDYVTSVDFMLLDTKNHIIKDLDNTDFYSEGRLRSHLQKYSSGSMFAKALDKACEYFNCESKLGSHRGLPTTTPYIMKKSIVKDLINTVEVNENENFCKAFLCNPRLFDTTEFILYYGFICQRGDQEVLATYKLQERNYVTFFNNSPATPAEISAEIARIGDPSVKYLGLHRGRKSKLTQEEKVCFVDTWLKAKLFQDEIAALAFIEKGDFT